MIIQRLEKDDDDDDDGEEEDGDDMDDDGDNDCVLMFAKPDFHWVDKN